MLGRRFALDTVIALGVALVCVGAAAEVAPAVGAAICAYAGIDRLIFTSPSDVGFLGLAVPFAVPAVFAWLAGLVERVQLHAPPAPRRLVLGFLAVLAGAILGIAFQAWTLARALDAMPADGMTPMFTFESLGLTEGAWRWSIVAGLCVCLIVGMRARRQVLAAR